MASPVRREGKQLLYSRSSDKHDLVSLPLIQSQRRKEYCHIRHFEKEGVGIVQYYDEDGIPTHSLLCRWIKGKICGKAYLFDMVEEKFSSVLTFADDKLMEEEPFSWGDLSIGIIDEFDGSRWEGMCLQEKAHGQGMFYDERNINIYSGYCMNGKKAGLGMSFYNFPNGSAVPKEIACWYHGQTYGLITLFDRRGDYLDTQVSVAGVTVGETINCVPGESLVFYPFVKKIVIADYCGQDEMSVFDLSHCPELISLTIGDHCFPYVVGCSFCHLPHLQEVMIGKDCFTFCNRSTHIPWETGCQQRIKKSRLSFELCHCPSLEVFECKEGSFSSYSGCTIEDLPRIRCLHLGAIAEENEEYEQGSWCFYWNASLVLKDLPCLEEIVFGNFSFYFCNSVIVDRCPRLVDLQCGLYSFCNYNSRKAGKLKLANLPLLTSITFCDHSFFNYNTVDLNNVAEEVNDRQLQMEIRENAWTCLRKIVRKKTHARIVDAFFVKRDYQPSISFGS